MSQKRIIAYFMHEQELGEAQQKMTNIEGTESFLLGDVEEEDISYLKDQGLIVQVLDDDIEEETTRLRSGSLVDDEKPGEIKPVIDTAGPNFYQIKLSGPLLESRKDQFKQLKVTLLEREPDNSYIAKLTPDQAESVNTLEFVKSLSVYGIQESHDTPTPRYRGGVAPDDLLEPPQVKSMVTYDIRLHQTEDLPQVEKWLSEKNVYIAGSTGRKIRIYLLEDSPLLDEIRRLVGVASADVFIPPKLHNESCRAILGIDNTPSAGSRRNILQTGAGQIVAVADTGIDTNHPDFQGRIVGLIGRGRPGIYDDPNGHGTHVAGSILGDGAASGGMMQGIAPGAELFFQSLLDQRGELGGLPLELGELFEEAYMAGARIHNNSWGAATASEYTINSIEVDEFVSRRRDMLIVISAGNEGQASNCRRSKPGFVDWLSVGSPASCKNALTVGASRSDRTQGGYADLTYKQVWPSDFPDPPIANQNVSSDPEAIAAFSSRGPCLDHRIKPDVVAPGTDVVSTRSSTAPLWNYWGPYSNDHYAYMGGTSMAAPLVSGCVALVREYYSVDRNHEPSASLLKATLINSTRWLKAKDATADHSLMPNYHQGFGCINMPFAIPNTAQPSLKVAFVDSWKDNNLQFQRSGQRFRFQFSIDGGLPLRICLVWTDPPGRGLQNNLNLILEHRQSGKKWVGNENLPNALTLPDPDNNVEVIRINPPMSGDYLIQVSASNILHSGQDFSLVVNGELTAQLDQY